MYKLRQQGSLVCSGACPGRMSPRWGSLKRQWSFAPVKVIQRFYASDFVCLSSKHRKSLTDPTVRSCKF